MFFSCNYKAYKIEYGSNYTISGSESEKSEGDDSEADYDLDPRRLGLIMKTIKRF